MASVTLTIAAGQNAGAALRRLSRNIEKMAASIPDTVSSGASTVVTFDNAVTAGALDFGVSITAGPYDDGITYTI